MSKLPVQVPKRILSEEFVDFANHLKGDSIPLSKILEMVELRGHSLLLILLAFPFMLPIPIPGLSVIFGLIIAIAGARIMIGLPPYVPKSWLSRHIPTKRAQQILMAASRLLAKIEGFLKPRLSAMFSSNWIKPLDGTLLILMGTLLALPLPPGTNFPPALSILCMGLGMLEKDGVFILLSYFFFTVNVLVFGAITTFGYEGATKLFGF